jgi:uncharacterized protein DUF4158
LLSYIPLTEIAKKIILEVLIPCRMLMEVKEVPRPVLTAIADQVSVPASTFASYGERENALYEHLDEVPY